MTGEGYKPLTDESVAAITSSYFAQRAARSSAQDQPRVVLVGGQPGAGKSAGGELVRDELKAQGADGAHAGRLRHGRLFTLLLEIHLGLVGDAEHGLRDEMAVGRAR